MSRNFKQFPILTLLGLVALQNWPPYTDPDRIEIGSSLFIFPELPISHNRTWILSISHLGGRIPGGPIADRLFVCLWHYPDVTDSAI